MFPRFHRQITTEALQGIFSHAALKTIVRSNIMQDVHGFIGRPEWHYNDNKIQETHQYIASQRELLIKYLIHNNPKKSWEAFGRLLHAAQDFYAHTNYIALWEGKHQIGTIIRETDFIDRELMEDAALVSGEYLLLQELLCMLPFVGRHIKNTLPKHLHVWNNLDSPTSGPLFELAYWAAVQRTKFEYEKIITLLKRSKNATKNIALFRGRRVKSIQ